MAQSRLGPRIAAVAAVMLAVVLVFWLAKGGDVGSTREAEVEHSNTQSQLGVTADCNTPADLDLVAAKAAISGTIRGPEGSPIPNAHVCATSDAEARLGIDDRTPRCVRADPHGRYVIDDLLPIATEVHASAATFKPARWERREQAGTRYQVRLRAGQTAKDIDITLEPGGVLIRGVIKDISGGVIEGAHVTIASGYGGPDESHAHALSDDAGEFEQWVAPGELAVIAQIEGYAVGWVLAVAPGQFVELFLTPESVLVGKVVLADSGEPVEGAVVIPGEHYSDVTAKTDANGRFRIDRLRPGTYKPSAETDALYGQAAEQVHLGLSETSDEVIIRVHPAVLVEGRVVITGAERPCTSGSVRLENSGVNSEYATLDDEGRVAFRGVLPGRYRVHVYCEGHIAEESYPELELNNENVGELEWEVREGLVIRGQVVDSSGEAVGEVRIAARPIVDGEAARTHTTHRSQTSSSDGSFELAGLLPGRYELSVSSWTETPRSPQPLVVELDGADRNDVRVVVSATGIVRGRVIDDAGKPVANAQMGAWLVGGRGYSRSRSNDAGEFEINELQPGSTRITASDAETWGAGSVMRRPGSTDDEPPGELVEVVANEVVELTLTVESRDGRIAGIVKDDGGGPVADAFVDVERMPERAGASVAAARRSVRWSWNIEPVLTDADGRFELTGLPDGQFILRANRKGGGDAILEGVALGSEVELVIASTNELSGTLALPDGSVPERFTIRIEDQAQGIAEEDSFFRTDGAWRFTELPAGRFVIKAWTAEGNATLEDPIELREGEHRGDIELVVQDRVTLRGRIVDVETREPVAGLSVFIRDSSRRSNNADKRHITDVDGRFELSNVSIGSTILDIWNRTGNETKYEHIQHALSVTAEPLVQDIGEIGIVAKRLGPNEYPGDLGYRINDWDPSIAAEEWKPIVASVRADGPAATTELAAGDVIEKIDGITVAGSLSRYSALTQVPVGRTVKLEIAGGTVVVIIAGPALI